MYDPRILDSRIEMEFKGAMANIQHTISPAVFDAAILVIAERFESYLRANVAADHPMLTRLDDHRTPKNPWQVQAQKAIALSRLRQDVYSARGGRIDGVQ